MDLEGSRVIAAPRDIVWRNLHDPEMLRRSIPGCEEFTGNPQDGFEAVIRQRIALVRITFKGAVRIENARPPHSYRLIGEGVGGVAGFAKGMADVTLTGIPEGTELGYKLDAEVGGKLAQLGSRITGGFASKMADTFFARFEALAEGRDPDAEEDIQPPE